MKKNLKIKKRKGFWLDENIGNNSFAFSAGKKIWVPGVKIGTVEDLKLGDKIVFADFENGEYKESAGLENHLWIVETKQCFVSTVDSSTRCNSNASEGHDTIPHIFICDNHNYVLEAWQYFKDQKPLLVHIDQHRDEALPLNKKIKSVIARNEGNEGRGNLSPFKKLPTISYQPLTNLTQTRICDYINWAKNNGWIQKEHISLCESKDFVKFKISNLKFKNNLKENNLKGIENGEIENCLKIKNFKLKINGMVSTHCLEGCDYILNIDLDIFAPEQTLIPHQEIIDLILELSKNACLITIALSPLFIDQKKALEICKKLILVLSS